MRIVVADANLLPLRADLEQALPAPLEVLWPDPADPAAVAAAVADAEVLVSGRCPAAVGAAGRSLRLVHAAGAGTDAIDVSALPPGAIVANTFHHEDSIAEYVVSTSILLRRGFLAQDAALRSDRWASPAHDQAAPWVDTLGAATIGFLGFGHIGARTWDRFRHFGARGIAVTRRGDVDAAAHGLEWAGAPRHLGAFLERSDILVVSCPLTPETRGVIGIEELARMKTSAVLVNVGRGPLVDEKPLYEALRDGGIAGAALDVWYSYPDDTAVAAPSAFAYRDLPNVLMTPHASGLTRQTFRARARDIVANVHRLAAGEALLNVVTVA